MSRLSEKIDALPTTNAGINISKGQVMDLARRSVEIKLHPELRDALADPAPKTDEEKVVWPLLDTAYQLVREAAVRAVFVEVRRQAAEQGITLGTDETLIRESQESGVEGAPRSVMDLAPDSATIASTFHAVFEGLFELALRDAITGLNDATTGPGE